MKNLGLCVLIILLLACAASAQVFPSAVATDANLLVGRNRGQSTLSGTITNTATTFGVAGASSFTNFIVVVIENEQIYCSTFSGTTFSGCQRGFDVTTAASHASGVAVRAGIVAAHHNRLASEIKAIEQQLCAGMTCVAKAVSLTTVGAIPYVSASGGYLAQDSALNWNAAANTLGINGALNLNGTAGTAKWALGNQTDNTFFLYDAAYSIDRMTISTGGLVKFQPSSGGIDLIANAAGSATATGIVNFGSSASTQPNKTGTTPPGGCGVGQTYFKTNEVAGENIHLCTAAGVWTKVSGGGGGGGGGGTPLEGTFSSQNPLVVNCVGLGGRPAGISIFTTSGTVATFTESWDSWSYDSSTGLATINFTAAATGAYSIWR